MLPENVIALADVGMAAMAGTLASVIAGAWPGVPPTQPIGILLPEFQTPLPDGFVGHDDPMGEQHLFDIPVAQAEAVIQPDTMTDDLSREAVVFI